MDDSVLKLQLNGGNDFRVWDPMCRQEVGGASFGASGVEAMQIQERMFESWLYSERIKSVMAGVIASLFAILAFSLVSSARWNAV